MWDTVVDLCLLILPIPFVSFYYFEKYKNLFLITLDEFTELISAIIKVWNLQTTLQRKAVLVVAFLVGGL